MKNNKVTIAQIAKDLGVSSISVSRAISGQSGVSEELREKILAYASDVGYKKIKAREEKEEFNILVLHQRTQIQDNTTFSRKVQGIEKALQNVEAEYSVQFVDKETQENLKLPYKLCKGRTYDGVIFIGEFQKPYVEFMKEYINNQVIFSGYSPSYECDAVWFNFNNAAYKQCEYLIKNGHKSIGFVGKLNRFKNKDKLIGISAALEDYGLEIKEDLLVDVDDNFEEKLNQLFDGPNPPTAIICGIDMFAIKLIKFLYKKGIRVPEDVSVVGSGNSEIATLCIPSLTTLELNIEYASTVAVDLLMRRMHDNKKPYEIITINSTLVERDSVKKVI